MVGGTRQPFYPEPLKRPPREVVQGLSPAPMSGSRYPAAMRIPRSVTTLIVGALVAVLAGACSGSALGGASPSPSPARPSVLPVMASSELGVGKNRAVFGWIDAATNRQVADPDRTTEVTFTGPSGEHVGPVATTFIWAIENERAVYAANVDFPVAGPWTAEFKTAAPGKPTETIKFGFDVKPETQVVRVGDHAPSVDTPTATDVGGDLSKLSTDTTPEPSFYKRSVADALKAGDPFVLAFATPKFCASAQCGPTLDRLKPIAKAHPDITFINVEPYELEDKDGQLQPVLKNNELQAVPAVRQFGLLSEPYIFVVDGKGIIRASYEAIFSEDEIEAALADL
jgi:hypothetical protein